MRRTGGKTHFQWYLQGILRPIISKHFCLRRIVFILNFSIPWPAAGTSPCRHCTFSKHIDMLGWTTVGWTGHWCVSLHGHKRSLCTTSTAYQHQCRFMYMNQRQTDQLTYHHKCTAYQHLCHFNEDEPWRAYYQERYHPPNPPDQHPPYQHLCHFNEDEPWRAYYQERYHPPTPQPTPSVSTPMSLQWRWTIEDLVEHLHVTRAQWTTSSCKTTSMYETRVQSIKMCNLSGPPSPV